MNQASSASNSLSQRGGSSGLHGESEDLLIEVAASGDSAAFEELYARYCPKLLRFLEGRLHGRQTEAEDVTQEAFAKAWASIGSFNRKYKFSTWLYTIAWRTALDSERKSKSVRLRVVPQMEDPCPPTEEALVAREQAHNIWRQARQVLSPLQFEMLWLHYGEELSVREIACVMKKSAVGVRVALHRARSKLQAASKGD